MSIYPGGKPKDLKYVWDVAAIDVPIPSRLIATQDIQEWDNYLNCLSPAQQLRKLGQALDQFHDLFEKTADPLALLEKDLLTLHSKWHAASSAAVAVAKRLSFQTEETYRSNFFKSDIDEFLFYIVDFLKNTHATDAPLWEERRERHNALDDAVGQFLLKSYHVVANVKKGPGGDPAPSP